MANQEENSPINAKMFGWMISGLCFLIGWYQTGVGVKEFRLFSSDYGGFIASFLVLLVLSFSYYHAIRKNSLIFLFLYLFCALINFACNFNSFYPNFMVDSLIRNEISEHRTNYSLLSDNIRSAFFDTQLDEFRKNVESKSEQLQDQIRQDGFGSKAKADLEDIEKLLNTRLTRLKTRQNEPKSWEETADKYKVIIDNALAAKIAENDYEAKSTLIKNVQESKEVIFVKVDNLLSNSTPITFPINETITALIDELVKNYQSYCITAIKLKNTEKEIQCNPSYHSENSDIGKFSHTGRSALNHLNEVNTYAIIIFCLLIDFIAPLAVYWHLKGATGSFWLLFVKRNEPQGL